MDHISSSTHFLPEELWATILVHVEENPQLLYVSKLFRDLCYDQDLVCKWLQGSLNSRGISDISDLLKTQNDLTLAKSKLIARVASYRPKSTFEYVRNHHIVPVQGFIKLLLEESAINLIHVYEKIPINKPEFASLKVLAKASAIRSFFQENREKIELIEKLDLSNIYITAVPEELELFTGLKEIYLQGNQINYLPSTFGSTFSKLEKCDLSINQLKVLPESFGFPWKNLTDLNLNDTHLSELPVDFGPNWEKLENLNIDFNQLKVFPESYTKWKKIQAIQFKRNPLPAETYQKIKSVFPRLLLC